MQVFFAKNVEIYGKVWYYVLEKILKEAKERKTSQGRFCTNKKQSDNEK